jgi:hypothetical protein
MDAPSRGTTEFDARNVAGRNRLGGKKESRNGPENFKKYRGRGSYLPPNVQLG